MKVLDPPPIEGELITETRDDQEFREICEGLEEVDEVIGGLRKPVKMRKSDYDSDFGLVIVAPNYIKAWSTRSDKQKK